jgi:hypothetical protein
LKFEKSIVGYVSLWYIQERSGAKRPWDLRKNDNLKPERPDMQYKTLDTLQRVAAVHLAVEAKNKPTTTMTRTERLERWANVLDQMGGTVATLHETEHKLPEVRAAMRMNSSAIAAAYRDPILRGAGLRGDTYGEALRFFEIDDKQLHDVICYCHMGERMNAVTAAIRVRKIYMVPVAKLPTSRRTLLERLCTVVGVRA